MLTRTNTNGQVTLRVAYPATGHVATRHFATLIGARRALVELVERQAFSRTGNGEAGILWHGTRPVARYTITDTRNAAA